MKMYTQVLATDLDGTLVGDKKGLEDLLEYYKKLPYKVTLIYVTGRHRDSALELIKEQSLPIPTFLITDVGTRIFKGPDMEEDIEWKRKMNTNWEPDVINEIVLKYPSISPQTLPTNCRVSFYISNEDHSIPSIEKQLKKQGLSYKMVYSSGKDLDILPKESGKGSALQYIIDTYVCEEASILVAGDSGNDEEMLTLGYPSVIVANAQPELRKIPKSNMIFRANKDCAGGILEAWLHFHAEKSSNLL